IVRLFDGFYFGCEADDPLVAWAYDNPLGITLKPVLGSDIGHWDVTDMRHVVHEAYELVEHGHLTADRFRAFTCDDPIRLHGRMNPDFFAGTPVAEYAAGLLADG
ncbi:MAG: amidohydrolase, partial [Streptomycetaceae bacterium]|nr:amidohydrolase [Streptomycetaceae bacterium]